MKILRLCALLLFTASLVIMLGACNENRGNEAPADHRSTERLINMYSTNTDTEYKVTSARKLYHAPDAESEITLYHLSPVGYAVVIDETKSLLQVSYNANYMELPEDEAVYYLTPFCTAVLRDGAYIRLGAEETKLTRKESDKFAGVQARVMNEFKELAAEGYKYLDPHSAVWCKPHKDTTSDGCCDICGKEFA